MSSEPAPAHASPLPAWVAAVHAASRALGVAAAGLIALSIFVICHMVFVRAVLNQSSIWQTEFVTYSLIAATFIGAPYILLTRGHVSVDVGPLMAGPPLRRLMYMVGSVIALVFCGIFFFASIEWWWDAWSNDLKTPSLWNARLWIPYLSVPVGMGLLCLQFIAEIWLVLTRRQHPFGLSPDERL